MNLFKLLVITKERHFCQIAMEQLCVKKSHGICTLCFRTTYGEVVCLENEGHFLVDFK